MHARFVEHAYPLHTHDTWTLLLVEDGAVHYDLGRRGHDTGALLTLLPPHVPHDGRAATATGFRKKVLYLDEDALPPGFAGRAVDAPELPDPRLVTAVRDLHARLATGPGGPGGPGPDALDVESRAAVLLDTVGAHLRRAPARAVRDVPLARRLRALLDGHVVEGVRLTDASAQLGVSAAHLVRTFTREVGMPPHAYLTARRVDLARRLLLAGHRPAEAAVLAGFHDQPHLNRHFRRVLGTTPGAFAAG
nr:AraC family transcriptional regulator [Kineococcus aurantiacus]